MKSTYNIKEIRNLRNFTQQEFASVLGVTRELVNKMEKGKSGVSKSTAVLLQKFIDEYNSEVSSHETTLIGQPFQESAPALSYLLTRREQKGEKQECVVPLIGVKAQAGYVKDYEQVDTFVDTLDKYTLPPGVKPGGAQWCYFEIDGDSMEPTFSSGDIILASVVHTEDWQDIKDFNTYVILTRDRLVVKRVFRKSADEWVLISDNEEAYPQKLMPVAEIKEVWTFRRHIRATAAAPKEITVKL